MKKSICLISSILLFMSGCLSYDDEVATSASQTEVVAQAPASVGSSGLSGKTVTFNPTLVFSTDGLTVDYSNSATDGNYPNGSFSNITLTDEVVGDRLIVTITVNGEKLDLGFSFIDRGGEGYIDEVVLDLVEVDDQVQVLPAEISVLVSPGTVRNEKVAEAALPDFSGAPTEAEWNQYLVGTAMLFSESSIRYGTDRTLVQFTSSSSGTYVDMEDGDTGTFTYSYSLTDASQNIGKITISLEWENLDDTDTPDQEDLDFPGTNGHTMREDYSKSLSFTNFFEGSSSDNSGSIMTDIQTGKVYPLNESELYSGTFTTITSPIVYLKNNPATN